MARQLKVSVILESIAQTKGFQRFNQELRATQMAAKKLQPALDAVTKVMKVGGAAAAAVAGILIKTSQAAITYASATRDMANASGVSTEVMQVLGHTARVNGAALTDMSTSMAELQKKAVEAANGNSGLIDKFSRLGISAKDFVKLRPEEQMERFGRAIANTADEKEALALTMDLIGADKGPKLMASLRALGTEGYAAMATQAKAAGVVMAEDMVQRLDEAGDRIETLKTRLTILGGVFADTVLRIESNNSKLNRALEAVAIAKPDSFYSAYAQLDLADAQLGEGNLKAARGAMRKANVSGVLPSASDNQQSMLLSQQRDLIGRILAAEEAARKKSEADGVQAAADKAEKERAIEEATAAERQKAKEKLTAEGIKRLKELEERAAEEENEREKIAFDNHAKAAKRAAEKEAADGLAAAQRYQDALDAVAGRDVNDYQRRGLALGPGGIALPTSVAPDPFAPTITPTIAVPTSVLSPNSAGREDTKTHSLLNQAVQQLSTLNRTITNWV